MKYTYDHIIKILLERDLWTKVPLYSPISKEKQDEEKKLRS
tara:strand:- start:237 stop:359 length:123 start_codon:yes stop_codon:yes gene_type:complete